MAYLDTRINDAQRMFPNLGSGDEWFVSSVRGSTNNDGRSMSTPKASIAQVQALAGFSAGDTIICLEDHAETITAAGGITLATAGINVIGIGRGSRRPTLTFSTAATATLLITGANILLRNFRFVNAIDSLVKFVDVNADDFTIEDCYFAGASTLEVLSFINIRTTKDNLTIRRCVARQATDPAGTDGGADTGFLYFVDTENILVEDCNVYGNFETAIFHNRTTAGKNLVVRGGYYANLLSGAEPFQLVDGCTGGAFGDGMCYTPAETAATEATLFGTLGNSFFISPTFTAGNDGGAGGQGGIIAATAS